MSAQRTSSGASPPVISANDFGTVAVQCMAQGFERLPTNLYITKCYACIRQRIWGSLTMTQSFFKNSTCWFEHMKLDPETGMDPQDQEIRLRAAEGLEAVDFFFPGYHVWAKLIESLADIGYDSNNLVRQKPFLEYVTHVSVQLLVYIAVQHIFIVS